MSCDCNILPYKGHTIVGRMADTSREGDEGAGENQYGRNGLGRGYTDPTWISGGEEDGLGAAALGVIPNPIGNRAIYELR